MGKDSDASYQRQYYLKNKERIAERKRQRYQNDSEYRKVIKKAREKHRSREKQDRKRRKKMPPKAQRPGKRMRILVGSEKVVVIMFSISQAAYRIGIALPTFRKWERKGVVPEAMYRSKAGQRLYTADQVAAVAGVYKEFKAKTQPWRLSEEFSKAVYDAWNALPGGVKPEEYDNEE